MYSGNARAQGNQLERAFLAREAKKRVADETTQRLTRYVDEDRARRGAAEYDVRVEASRREREARERASEEAMLDGLYANARNAEIATQRAGEEDALAKVMESRKKEAERQERLLQKVRQESEELRWLQEKLRAAEVNRERAVQLTEAEAVKARDVAAAAALDALIDRNRAAAQAADEEKLRKLKEQAVAARKVLEEQMAERVVQQQAALAAYEAERAAVDAVAAQVAREDADEARRKWEKQEETKRYVADFLLLRERERAALAAARAAEDAKIEAYQAELSRRAEVAASKKAEEEAAREAIFQQLSAEAKRKAAEQEAYEALLNQLYYEEREAEYRDKEAAAAARKEAAKRDIIAANEHQRLLKAQRRAAERAEEERFRAHMLAKFAEDDRVEQLNAQRRRMKVEEHKREVERLWADKAAMYDAQRAAEDAEAGRAAAEEAELAGLVAQERARLIREHAAHLKGYLPKGVLANAAEADMLNEAAAKLQLGAAR